MKRWRWLLALALVLVMVAAACGDDDDEDAATGSGSGSETTEADAGSEVPVVAITATDDVTAKKFEFPDLPSEIEGGVVTFELANEGKEGHDLQLVMASDGRSLEDMLEVVGSEDAPVPRWVQNGAGLGLVRPGETISATVDLEPGTWWYFCSESSGEDGEERISHAANGMSGEFTVEGESGAELPATDASVTAADYRFDIAGLKAGENTFTFENAGKNLHHALAFPIAEGKTFADAQTFLTTEGEPTGPPPVDFENSVGTAVIGPGQSQVVTWDLKPGSYAVLCFMPDYETAGPPHVAKGMITELKIS